MDNRRTESDEIRINSARKYQEAIKEKCNNTRLLVRLCPYCSAMVETLYQGSHGYSQKECPECGKIITFAPILFRKAR